ncbi:zinc ribbon domain-containing protein [Halovivax sp.]|uniref:zinc ribbon domain-containing protein n=1 Tax=Halovivax sp. TaxID=1935978 RepID=UPI0025BC54AA|nr:zinc ribbon domain-containing protein [Halovivax sp.]
MNWIRALAAAGLSVLLPGAGHALLRDWTRAALFAAMFVATVVMLLPVQELWASADGAITDVPATVADGVAIVEAETSALAQFTVMFLVLFAAVDAGLRGLGIADGPANDDDAPACPSCGKPLDDDLTFCHWCTTRIEREDEPAST